MGYPPRKKVPCRPCNGTGQVGAGRTASTCTNCNGAGEIG